MTTTPEQIKERITKSRKKYGIRRAKNRVYQEKLTAGRAYVKEKQNDILIGNITPDISFAIYKRVATNYSVVFELVFAFKNSRDFPSQKVANGVLGHKLSHGHELEISNIDILFTLAKNKNRPAFDIIEGMVRAELIEGLLAQAKNVALGYKAPSWALKEALEAVDI